MGSNYTLDGLFFFFFFEVHSWIFEFLHTLHRILYPDTLFSTINFVLNHLFLILKHKPSPLICNLVSQLDAQFLY